MAHRLGLATAALVVVSFLLLFTAPFFQTPSDPDSAGALAYSPVALSFRLAAWFTTLLSVPVAACCLFAHIIQRLKSRHSP